MVTHHLGKLYPDPDPHQNEQQDPDPYQSRKLDPFPHPDPERCGRSQCRRRASKWSHGRRFEITLMRTRIRIRITAGSRILIHIKVKKSDLDPNQNEKRNPLVRMRIKMKRAISLLQIRNTDLTTVHSALLSRI
jgi:hypothetical protein